MPRARIRPADMGGRRRVTSCRARTSEAGRASSLSNLRPSLFPRGDNCAGGKRDEAEGGEHCGKEDRAEAGDRLHDHRWDAEKDHRQRDRELEVVDPDERGGEEVEEGGGGGEDDESERNGELRRCLEIANDEERRCDREDDREHPRVAPEDE